MYCSWLPGLLISIRENFSKNIFQEREDFSDKINDCVIFAENFANGYCKFLEHFVETTKIPTAQFFSLAAKFVEAFENISKNVKFKDQNHARILAAADKVRRTQALLIQSSEYLQKQEDQEDDAHLSWFENLHATVEESRKELARAHIDVAIST